MVSLSSYNAHHRARGRGEQGSGFGVQGGFQLPGGSPGRCGRGRSPGFQHDAAQALDRLQHPLFAGPRIRQQRIRRKRGDDRVGQGGKPVELAWIQGKKITNVCEFFGEAGHAPVRAAVAAA